MRNNISHFLYALGTIIKIKPSCNISHLPLSLGATIIKIIRLPKSPTYYFRVNTILLAINEKELKILIHSSNFWHHLCFQTLARRSTNQLVHVSSLFFSILPNCLTLILCSDVLFLNHCLFMLKIWFHLRGTT